MLYRQNIHELISKIDPFDQVEKEHKENALTWVESGAPLCRIEKPDNPPKHLVSYFLLIDSEKREVLLVDHKKSSLWLPAGGHVEPDEHPRDTAHRELDEELGVRLTLVGEEPQFISVTKTVGQTAGHTDVSLWYLFNANNAQEFDYDEREFHGIKWFSLDRLPLLRTDPHLERFCQKWEKVGSCL